MTAEVKKTGLPTWAKVLIGMVVFAIISGIIAVVGLVYFVQDTVKKAQDPAVIAKTAREIAEFTEPLPAGYKFALALDMFGVKTVTVEHDSDKQTLIFMTAPPKEDMDANALVTKLFEAGIKAPTHPEAAGGRFDKEKSRGTETVGGEPMPYIVGTMSDKSGSKFEGLVGAIVSKPKHKTVIVYGIQPGDQGYNMETTRTLLKTIKGF